MELKTRFKVIMSSEADAFLDTLRQDVKDKIIYNVDKVANGYMDKDLFKKLDDTDIWEFRTLYKGIQYRLLAFLGHRRGNVGHCHAWICEENTKDPTQRDKQGGSRQNIIFQLKKISIWKQLNFIPLMKLRINI